MKRTLISMLTLLAVTAASADNYSYGFPDSGRLYT